MKKRHEVPLIAEQIMKGFVKNLRSGKFIASSKSQGPYRLIYIPVNDSSIIQLIDFLLQF